MCLLESDTRLGHGTSTRNSGVIHAGLYYPAGSLKAALCVEGRDRLYDFAARTTSPTIAAASSSCAHAAELGALKTCWTARPATASTAELVDRRFILAREPHVTAVAALWSPKTGIVEAEAFVRA